MFFFFLACFVLYLLLALVTIPRLFRNGRSGLRRASAAGSVIGFVVTLTLVFAALAIFESDESYWYYGPSWRFDLLALSTFALSIGSLVGFPVLFAYRFSKSRPPEPASTENADGSRR